MALMSFGIIAVVLLADQIFKFWVKTNMRLGQNIPVAGDWFIMHFTENNGMAFGIEFAGPWGKLFLTLFRLVAVGGILYYLIYQIKLRAKPLTVVLISLIFAGAVGNIIDSVFYGKWFTASHMYEVATWANGDGYSSYFHGKVVDMLYFPLIEGYYPHWIPVLGGKEMIFFRPVFNLADAAISTGVFSILLFKRDLFQFDEPKKEKETAAPLKEAGADRMPETETDQNQRTESQEDRD